MKILSKYKDFYDYLTGLYGEDPLLILDRTKWNPLPYSQSDDTIIRLYIGGYLIEGYKQNGKYWWGEDLKQFSDEKKYRPFYFGSHYDNPNINNEDIICLKNSQLRYNTVLIRPVLDTKLINEKEDCPILREWHSEKYLRYPILSELGLSSFISPEQMYKMISEWLSYQRTKAEDKPDNRSNVEKIQTNGFDNKTSFRGK